MQGSNHGVNTTAMTGTLTAPDRLRIGAGSTTGGAVGNYCAEDVMEVAVWNAALTDDECTALASFGPHPLLVRPQNLIRCYDMLNLNCRVSQHSLTNVNSVPMSSARGRHKMLKNPNRVIND